MCIDVNHVHGAGENVKSHLLTGGIFAKTPLEHGWDVWKGVKEGSPSLFGCMPDRSLMREWNWVRCW